MPFFLYNDKDEVSITKDEARILELALNKTTNAQLWRFLGDVLYDWHCGHERPDRMYADPSQLQWVRATLNI